MLVIFNKSPKESSDELTEVPSMGTAKRPQGRGRKKSKKQEGTKRDDSFQGRQKKVNIKQFQVEK
jgi:hypothetical protein